MVALWMTGEMFAWLNQRGAQALTFEQVNVSPQALADLLQAVAGGQINQNTAKIVLAEMLETGRTAAEIISARGLQQISDSDAITQMIRKALDDNPAEVTNYLAGKESLANWFFGQVMRQAGGKANPQVVRSELERQLAQLKKQQS
jgi:aspartyl-tRNA(Asn)/glutamyl-tRNA(Gln) amidotransferase subunit B